MSTAAQQRGRAGAAAAPAAAEAAAAAETGAAGRGPVRLRRLARSPRAPRLPPQRWHSAARRRQVRARRRRQNAGPTAKEGRTGGEGGRAQIADRSIHVPCSLAGDAEDPSPFDPTLLLLLPAASPLIHPSTARTSPPCLPPSLPPLVAAVSLLC
eukprot:364410-Chlamydomonas_euryale.AAC.4